MEAVLIDSKYKIFQIDFDNMKAFVNKQDTYRKRNGKTCRVEHNFGKWISFKKEDIGRGVKSFKRYDSSVYGLEEVEARKSVKYLRPEVKERIIFEYKQLFKL
jgi:hypothetical protein